MRHSAGGMDGLVRELNARLGKVDAAPGTLGGGGYDNDIDQVQDGESDGHDSRLPWLARVHVHEGDLWGVTEEAC